MFREQGRYRMEGRRRQQYEASSLLVDASYELQLLDSLRNGWESDVRPQRIYCHAS